MPSLNHGVQKRAQDSHSAFNEEKRFEPEVGAVAKNADEDGNCDWIPRAGRRS